jgi:hypothetical protein
MKAIETAKAAQKVITDSDRWCVSVPNEAILRSLVMTVVTLAEEVEELKAKVDAMAEAAKPAEPPPAPAPAPTPEPEVKPDPGEVVKPQGPADEAGAQVLTLVPNVEAKDGGQ